MLSNTKWEILQLFPGVLKVSVVECQVGDFAGIPWGKQGQCCLTPFWEILQVFPGVNKVSVI